MEFEIHNPNNLPTVDYRILKPLQPDSFKDLSDVNFNKLTNSIKEHGWIGALFLWKDGEDFYIIDSHQRLRWLNKMKPEQTHFPYLLFDANDKKEAVKVLLAVNSHYGTETQEGFDEIIATYQIEEEYVEEVVVKTVYFTEEEEEINLTEQKQHDDNADKYINNTVRQIMLVFDNETHKVVLEKLKLIGEKYDILEDNSATVLKLIEHYENN